MHNDPRYREFFTQPESNADFLLSLIVPILVSTATGLPLTFKAC
jgi:hypothetical protein